MEGLIEISLSLIDNSKLHIVFQWDTYVELHFTKDGVPPTFVLPVCAFCDGHFPGKGIGH
jgi:hypothetical protein